MKTISVSISHSDDADDIKFREASEYRISRSTLRAAISAAIAEHLASLQGSRIRINQMKLSAKVISHGLTNAKRKSLEAKLEKARAAQQELEAQLEAENIDVEST